MASQQLQQQQLYASNAAARSSDVCSDLYATAWRAMLQSHQQQQQQHCSSSTAGANTTNHRHENAVDTRNQNADAGSHQMQTSVGPSKQCAALIDPDSPHATDTSAAAEAAARMEQQQPHLMSLLPLSLAGPAVGRGGCSSLTHRLQHGEAIGAEVSALLPSSDPPAVIQTDIAQQSIHNPPLALPQAVVWPLGGPAVGCLTTERTASDGSDSSVVTALQEPAGAAGDVTAVTDNEDIQRAGAVTGLLQQSNGHDLAGLQLQLHSAVGAASALAATAAGPEIVAMQQDTSLPAAANAAAQELHIVASAMGSSNRSRQDQHSSSNAVAAGHLTSVHTASCSSTLSSYLNRLMIEGSSRQQQQQRQQPVQYRMLHNAHAVVGAAHLPLFKPSPLKPQQQKHQRQQLYLAPLKIRQLSVDTEAAPNNSTVQAQAVTVPGAGDHALGLPMQAFGSKAASCSGASANAQQQPLTRLQGSLVLMGRPSSQPPVALQQQQTTSAAAAAAAIAARAAASAEAHDAAAIAQQQMPPAAARLDMLPFAGIKRRSSEETNFAVELQHEQQHNQLQEVPYRECDSICQDAVANKRARVDVADLLQKMSAVVEAAYDSAAAQRASVAVQGVLKQHGYIQVQ